MSWCKHADGALRSVVNGGPASVCKHAPLLPTLVSFREVVSLEWRNEGHSFSERHGTSHISQVIPKVFHGVEVHAAGLPPHQLRVFMAQGGTVRGRKGFFYYKAGEE